MFQDVGRVGLRRTDCGVVTGGGAIVDFARWRAPMRKYGVRLGGGTRTNTPYQYGRVVNPCPLQLFAEFQSWASSRSRSLR